MNKQEILAVVLLSAALFGWFAFQQKFMPPPARRAPAAAVENAATNAAAPGALPSDAALGAAEGPSTGAEAVEPAGSDEAEGADAAEGDGADEEVEPDTEPQHVRLSNDVCSMTVSSRGGTVSRVELRKYRATVEEDSGPVELDFGGRPALAITGIRGLSPRHDFAVEPGETASTVRLRQAVGALALERELSLDDNYRILVTDRFTNRGSEPVTLPPHAVAMGPMNATKTASSTAGLSYTGVDTLADEGGEGVQHWGKKQLPALFGQASGFMSCARQDLSGMPLEVEQAIEARLTWMAVKNKYFVQVLAPEGGSAGGRVQAARAADPKAGFVIDEVVGELRFGETVLEPGASLVRTLSYYAGPKEYTSLKRLGGHQAQVMEFGWYEWFRWLCQVLLWTLNAIHSVLPNYGVAVILLTLIVKILFWPVTHKSTESMKKMQQIQPLVTEIRTKFKDKPQKMNQEIMDLYKKHKVNPMAGCLPMLVQIPVFFALFVVLRSAVELRFAPFLWVRDLSEPEGLLAGVLPIPLNILPLLMTATTILQQKLTPSAGDPQQQKMMMMMPVVMLFLFYSMPSALVLYWTVSQALSIVQMAWQRRKPAPALAAA